MLLDTVYSENGGQFGYSVDVDVLYEDGDYYSDVNFVIGAPCATSCENGEVYMYGATHVVTEPNPSMLLSLGLLATLSVRLFGNKSLIKLH
jgi:hypothetical protein